MVATSHTSNHLLTKMSSTFGSDPEYRHHLHLLLQTRKHRVTGWSLLTGTEASDCIPGQKTASTFSTCRLVAHPALALVVQLLHRDCFFHTHEHMLKMHTLCRRETKTQSKCTCHQLVYVQDKDGDENWHLFAQAIDTPGAPRELTPFKVIDRTTAR